MGVEFEVSIEGAHITICSHQGNAMKHTLAIALSFALFLLSSCSSTFYAFSVPDRYNCEFSSTERRLGITTRFTRGNLTMRISNRGNKGDVMRSMYISEARFVLPSGESIDLLDSRIRVNYVYIGFEEIAGVGYTGFMDTKPKQVNGRKVLDLGGLADHYTVAIEIDEDVPPDINSIDFVYSLTVEWENFGIVEERCTPTFKKTEHTYYWFSH